MLLISHVDARDQRDYGARSVQFGPGMPFVSSAGVQFRESPIAKSRSMAKSPCREPRGGHIREKLLGYRPRRLLQDPQATYPPLQRDLRVGRERLTGTETGAELGRFSIETGSTIR
eukprot:3160394-Rhodomonas_salina.2